MHRAMHLFPKQGNREAWTNPQNCARDKKTTRFGALEDGALVFGHTEEFLSFQERPGEVMREPSSHRERAGATR